jgi:CMP-N-acetylneuraminic acid synthetase
MTGVLGIVPARGGSKGVPGKNLRLLAGRTLIAYTAEAARASGVVDRLVLSTDDQQIAEAGRCAGIEVPFMRPAALASDDAPMLGVIDHALRELAARGDQPEMVVLLQPTSPLRRAAHIRSAVTLLRESAADSVVSVVAVPRHLSPDYVMRIDAGRLRPFLPEGAGLMRRQDARQAYSRDGTVYAFWTRTLERFGSIYGDDSRPMVIDAAESLSIDSPEDWAAAERILAGEHTGEHTGGHAGGHAGGSAAR